MATWRAWRTNAPRFAAVARHCVRFATWSSLEAEGLADEEKVRLVGVWLERLAGGA